jgi:hypothetical protein
MTETVADAFLPARAKNGVFYVGIGKNQYRQTSISLPY